MTGFDPDWLALRHVADLRARNPLLAAALTALFRERSGLRVVDIGAGSGMNLRALAPLLPAGQDWLAIDHDADLLARIEAPPGVSVRTRQADLSAGLAAHVAGADLVTCSAFLDLAGREVVADLAGAVAAAGAAFLAVLTYDGRQRWEGGHPADAAMLAAFNADQRRDKGLGPALGPDAHAETVRALEDAGMTVAEGPSDWRLEAPRDAALIAELARGTAKALAAAVPAADAWHRARRACPRVVIGHRDLLAVPAAQ